MPTAERLRELKDIARQGKEVYERVVLPHLRSEDDGKFVAIDIRTGEYELDVDDHAAIVRLRTRQPQAEGWLARVGHPAAYRL